MSVIVVDCVLSDVYLVHVEVVGFLCFVVWACLPETANSVFEQKEVFTLWQSRQDPKIHQKCWLRIQDSTWGTFAAWNSFI